MEGPSTLQIPLSAYHPGARIRKSGGLLKGKGEEVNNGKTIEGYKNSSQMTNNVYQVNKSINRSIEFHGLKAQYIWYLGGGMGILFMLYVLLYSVVGLPSYWCIGVVLLAGTGLIITLYSLSNTYGEHGLTKALARKHLPGIIKSRSRKVFFFLSKTDKM